MNFRLTDILETNDFQYVRIIKNGCTSITNLMKEKYGNENIIRTRDIYTKKPRWAVVRDPYERFISGLNYDLKKHDVKIEDINIKKIFTCNEPHLRNLILGNVSHTVSQIPYLMNNQVTHYIDINDLDIFLKMHFNKTLHANKNKNKIHLNIDKEEVMKYLHLDYYIYNNIKNSPFFWEWQHGRIF